MPGPVGDRRHLPLVFVADLAAPDLQEADDRHLRRSLRLREGAAVGLGDGRGGWRRGRLLAAGVDVDGPVVLEEPKEPALAVGFTPVKNERAEWFVQKLTELGIDRIVPLVTDRGVVRWDEKRAAKLAQRFETTAREAAMQSRRLRLPVIDRPTAVDDLADSESMALADPDGDEPGPELTMILVGPEGGWSDGERADRRTVALPGGVLRSETAAIVAGSILAGLRSGLVTPPRDS